jgi:hypothetical protein
MAPATADSTPGPVDEILSRTAPISQATPPVAAGAPPRGVERDEECDSSQDNCMKQREPWQELCIEARPTE